MKNSHIPHTSPTHILLLLCLATTLTKASLFPNSLFDLAERPLLNAYATQSGTVPLVRDELGFYASVDLASYSSDASDTTPNPGGTVNAMLALYSPTSSLITNCLNFSGYSCYQPRCSAFNGSNATTDYLYFTAQGYEAAALLYLDYNNWFLENYAMIITSCDTNANTSLYANTREAIVGLGVSAESKPNFMNNPSFSVFIAKNLSNGDLIFSLDETKIQEHTNGTSITCDENWRISTSTKSYLKIRKHNITLNASIIFDITMDSIGLPQYLYNQVLGLFNETDNITCSDSILLPSCDYNGNITDLPNITIFIQKNQTIVIPPAIYVQNALNQTSNVSSITLNFRALSPNLSNDNYVTPKYDNHIILDMNFMSYYYTYFHSGGTWGQKFKITLYISGQGVVPDDSSNNSLIYVIIGIVALIILIGVGCFVYHYYYKPRQLRLKKAQKALLKQQEGDGQEVVQEEELSNKPRTKTSINVY